MKMIKFISNTILITGISLTAIAKSADAQTRGDAGGSSNNNRNIEFELDSSKPGKILNIDFLSIPTIIGDDDTRSILESQLEADVTASFIEVGFESEIFSENNIFTFEENYDLTTRFNLLANFSGSKFGIVEIEQELREDNPALSTGSTFITIAKWIEYKASLDFGEFTFYLPLCDPTICDNNVFNFAFPDDLEFFESNTEITEAPSDPNLLDVSNLIGLLGESYNITGILEPNNPLPADITEPGVGASIYGIDIPIVAFVDEPAPQEPFGLRGDLTDDPFSSGVFVGSSFAFGVPITIQTTSSIPESSNTISLLILGGTGLLFLVSKRKNDSNY